MAEKKAVTGNALQTWTNEELGTIRSMTIDGEPFIVDGEIVAQ